MVAGFTDIAAGGWVGRLPAGWRPYAELMRLDRPIGTWLLLLPGWWSLGAAPRAGGYGWQDLWLAVLFGVGAIVMRGAGCVVNDMIDRDLDARVERTRGRPLPSGRVSLRQAALLLAGLLVVGLMILLQFNRTTVVVGAASLVLVGVYPLMKRVTWWPQAFLGLTFNWGALVGWTAVTGSLDWPAALLYAGGFFWTLGYDTIYAHQDKVDDALVGIRSTALRLGDRSRAWIAGFYAVALAWLLAAGVAAELPLIGLVLIAASGLQLAWQLRVWQPDRPASSLAMFRSNRWFGLAVAAAIVIGNW